MGDCSMQSCVSFLWKHQHDVSIFLLAHYNYFLFFYVGGQEFLAFKNIQCCFGTLPGQQEG